MNRSFSGDILSTCEFWPSWMTNQSANKSNLWTALSEVPGGSTRRRCREATLEHTDEGTLVSIETTIINRKEDN